jgi:hypothetical protein
MLQVIDIPLNFRASAVRSVLEHYGEIEKIEMRTKPGAIYQQAFVEYKKLNVVTELKDKWATFIERHMVRMIPISLIGEDREIRNRFCKKLTGFKKGTSARDLAEVLDAVDAKACFIPREGKFYSMVNYAYVYFESEEKKKNATNTQYAMGEDELIWCDANAKTCHECGAIDHLFANCEKRKRFSRRDQNIRRLYNKYKPANHRKQSRMPPPSSYVEAVKRNIHANNIGHSRFHNRYSLTGNNSHGLNASIHNPNNINNKINSERIVKLENDMKKIDNNIKTLLQAISELSKKINNLGIDEISNKTQQKSANSKEKSTEDANSSSSSSSLSKEENNSDIQKSLQDVTKCLANITKEFKDLKNEMQIIKDNQEYINTQEREMDFMDTFNEINNEEFEDDVNGRHNYNIEY